MIMAPAPAYSSGIGLRTPHFRAVLSTKPAVGYFEVHSENYFGAGGQPLSMLERVRHDYPIRIPATTNELVQGQRHVAM